MKKLALQSVLCAVICSAVCCSGAEDPASPEKNQGMVKMEQENRQSFQLLNIVPLTPHRKKEYAQDLLKLYDSGAISETAYIMTLVPESDPPVEKAKILAEQFRECREALGKTSMPVGILLQATMGHGWMPSEQSAFQKQIPYPENFYPYMFCPLDKNFRKYVYDSVRILAELKPDFFMVDDDFRLLTGKGGCFCPLHIAEFNRRTGKNYTSAAELKQAVNSDAGTAQLYDRIMIDSLTGLAQEIRRAIDETDPSIPCSFCACVQDTRHAIEVTAALTAKGQTPKVRINNAMYQKDSPRMLHAWMHKTASQILAYPADWQILCEPDTCPQTRYSTSAAMMHSVITHSITEGAKGGKLWITRRPYEPESGTLYRKILTENAGFYRTLASLKVKWEGVATILPEVPAMNFPLSRTHTPEQDCTWAVELLGRMGIPTYYTTGRAAAAALTQNDVRNFTDAQLDEIIKNSKLLLDGSGAAELTRRGFGEKAGVSGEVWQGAAVTFEQENGFESIPVSGALKFVKLSPHGNARTISHVYHSSSGLGTDAEAVMPAVIKGENFAAFAAPVCRFSLTSSGWLNNTRKQQIVRMLTELDVLPCYIPGDHELFIKTGLLPDGRLIFLNNLSLDAVPQIEIAGLKNRPDTVEQLMPSGEWQEIAFDWKDGVLTIAHELRTMQPKVLRLK